MRSWTRLAVATCLLAAAPPAQETLSDSALKDLKAATVFIRTARGSGSGFIIRREGRTAYVLTCAPVILESGLDPVKGVWNAGTENEIRVEFKVIGVDPDGDIAVLRCDMKDPPPPLPFAPASRLRETIPVFVAGFPLGEGLSTNSRSPAPTIGKASIAAFRADESGANRVVQLDGQLNPGVSGGPVVDGRGALVGMAAAKASDAKIAFAVASTEIADLMEGRVFPPVLVVGSGNEDTVKVRVYTGIVDPLKRVRSPSLLLVPKIKLPAAPKPGDKGAWGPISDAAEEIPLRIIEGVIDQVIVVRKGESEEGRFLAQVKYSRDGVACWTAPVHSQFDFQSKAPAPKEPEAGRRPETPPAGSKLDFEVRLDESGRDAVLVLERAEPDAPALKQFQWNDRTGAQWIAYSADLKTAYAISESRLQANRPAGTLVRKINLETFREERSLYLDRAYSGLDLCPLGLVTTTFANGQAPEALVLDPATLQVVGRLSGFGYTLLISRSSTVALTVETQWITFFDLAKGAVVNRIGVKDLAARKEKPKVAPGSRMAQGLKSPALSGDGKFLLALEEGSLHRFRVKGTDLAYEEVGPRLHQSDAPFVLSPDSRHALVLSIPEEREKYKEKGFERERVKTFIDERWLFRIESLATPACRLRGFSLAHFLDFDPSGGSMFVLNGSRERRSAKDVQRIGIDGRRSAEFPNLDLTFGRCFALSAKRMLVWDAGLRVYEFPK